MSPDEVVARYGHLVHGVALWAARRTPHDIDDLQGWGYEALLRLPSAWLEQASTPLVRACLKLRVLDACRVYDHNRRYLGPRNARRFVKVRVYRPLTDAEATALISADSDPADVAAERDLVHRVLAMIAELPERDRDIMSSVAVGEPLTSIARRHGVSASRVCHIRSRFIADARARLMNDIHEGAA